MALVSLPALAQSEGLLDAVRVHREGVAAIAKQELQTCIDAGKKCADRERLALLTGVLQLSEGDAASAVEVLSATKPPKGLESIHAWYLGEAQSWGGQRPQAVKTLLKAKKAAPPWLATRVDRKLAELYLELKQPAKTSAILDVDSDVGGSPELLYTRALARSAQKLTALARNDWKALALKFPAHPHGVVARERLIADGAWNPTFDEQLSRAQALLAAGSVSECLESISSLTTEKSDQKAKLALLRGQALLSRGKERDADAKAELATAMEGPPSIAAQALLLLAKRSMRTGDNVAARATFQKLDTLYPTDSNADEAGYLAAWLAMNSGDFDAAVKDFAEFETRHADSKKRDEARWFRAFTLVRAKKYADAREVAASLPKDFPKSSLVPQALYWAARSAELMPASDAGTGVIDVSGEYRALLNGFPGTFYGLLASERLAGLGVTAPLPFTSEPKQLTVKRPAGLELAASLARTGLYRDCAAEVSRALAAMPAGEALTWGHALQGLGDFGAAHTLAARHLWGAVYTQRTPEALALMYPRAFRNSVEAWAQQHELEPALAWAIMRRESAFAPEVTSIADARGLMQLIPPTARGVAAQLKIPPADDAELYSPDWNIRLGTWYLHALMKRLGHPTLVAAAYNGGPDAVAKWAKERGSEPLDQWVEEIPYKETRGYVKQVTADLFIYRQLYGFEQKRLSLVIPAPGEGVNF
ncbi:MAG: transglycosylase SLT domain-containing protein [Archangium sp.]